MRTIRALRPSDDRSTFHSGDLALDRFFRTYAGQNQFRHHIGTSYVAVDAGGRLVGFATAAAASLEVDGLPADLRKKLPSYPLPVLRLARLAVDDSVRGQGIGSALLKYVFGLAVAMADGYGCLGVVVDAYPAAVAFYEPYGFLPLDVIEGESSARPQPTALFLSLREIAAAAR